MTKVSKKVCSLTDVANRAGVAVSTVSRVVNSSPLVSNELRKKVEKVIEEMGYRPEPRERRKGVRRDPLHKMKNKLVNVVIFGPYDSLWITNYAPIYSYVLHGIDERLGQYGLKRAIVEASNTDDLMKILEEKSADGYLVLKTNIGDQLPDAVSKYPVVAFMGLHECLACDRVVPDGNVAGACAAEFLKGKGCEFFIAIGGDQDVYNHRTVSFRKSLQASGLPVVELRLADMVRGGNRMHQVNRSVISKHLPPVLSSCKKRPIGIFSLADIVTPALYAELAELGMEINRDVFIVSCNNERPYLDPLIPQPSAVIDIQAEHIGRRAVEMLIRRLEVRDSLPYEMVRVVPSVVPAELW